MAPVIRVVKTHMDKRPFAFGESLAADFFGVRNELSEARLRDAPQQGCVVEVFNRESRGRGQSSTRRFRRLRNARSPQGASVAKPRYSSSAYA